MRFRNIPRATLLSLIDVVRYNYTYHSGALTYHFMLSIAPLTIVLVHLFSLLLLCPIKDSVSPEASYSLRLLYSLPIS